MAAMSLDETQLLLAFFAVVSGLLMYYSLNLANGMDEFKKEKKDARNAIKNSMETQNVLPLVIKIFVTLSSKLNVTESDKLEDDLDLMIYNKENWPKLDLEIRNLEEKISEMSEVDKVFNSYINYTSYLCKVLFLLTGVVAAIILVYIFGDFIVWVVWTLVLMQVIMCAIILKWKAAKASSKFDSYEDSYIK